MKRNFWKSPLPLLAVAAGLMAMGMDSSRLGATSISVTGDTEYVHDPSIIKDGDSWYLFGTANGPIRNGELPIRCSKDLHEWKRCGNVFPQIPQWIKQETPKRENCGRRTSPTSRGNITFTMHSRSLAKTHPGSH